MDKCRDRKSAISWESEGLWTLNLEHEASCSIRLPTLKFIGDSEDMADFRSRHLSVLWPWPLIFRPLNGVTGHPCHGPPSCQRSACSGMGQTDDRRPSTLNVPPYGGGHNNLFDVIFQYFKYISYMPLSRSPTPNKSKVQALHMIL